MELCLFNKFIYFFLLPSADDDYLYKVKIFKNYTHETDIFGLMVYYIIMNNIYISISDRAQDKLPLKFLADSDHLLPNFSSLFLARNVEQTFPSYAVNIFTVCSIDFLVLQFDNCNNKNFCGSQVVLVSFDTDQHWTQTKKSSSIKQNWILQQVINTKHCYLQKCMGHFFLYRWIWFCGKIAYNI